MAAVSPTSTAQSPGRSHDDSRSRRLKTWTTLVERRAACTHLSLSRLYDPTGTEKCQYCRQPSSFGWLYCCTQDHDKFIPDPSLSVADHNAALHVPLSAQPAARDLSLSVRNGIKNGHYDKDQIQLLLAQKQHLKEHLESLEAERESIDAIEELNAWSDLGNGDDHGDLGNQDESSHSSSTSSGYESAVDESDPPLTMALKRKEKEQDISAIVSGQDVVSPEPPKPPFNSIFTTLKQPTKPLTPPCLFRCCPRCRPTYRERGFQSLNAIINEPVKHPPQWELDNRPISDANIVRNFHPGPPPWQLRHLYQTFEIQEEVPDRWDSESSPSKSTDRPPASTTSRETETARNPKPKPEHKKRLSLRYTLRKALTILEPSQSLARSSSSSSSGPKTPRRTLTKRRPSSTPAAKKNTTSSIKPSPSKPERENRITNNASLQDSLALMLAVNTPLPRGSEDVAGLAGDGGDVIVDEVRVEDGIAVTEEAVGEGEADIIIHV